MVVGGDVLAELPALSELSLEYVCIEDMRWMQVGRGLLLCG